MISHRSWLSITACIAATVAFGAACSSGSKSKGKATPTPLDLSITNYYSQSTNKSFRPGECAGFKVVDATKQLDQTTVAYLINESNGSGYAFVSDQLNANGAVLAINETAGSMTIGGGLEYPCITWGLDTTPGPYDFYAITQVTTTTTAEGIVTDAVDFSNSPIPVMSLGTALGTFSKTLQTVHDEDYFDFTAGHGRSVLEVASTDTSFGFTPFQYAFLPDYSSFFNEGFDVAIETGLVSGVKYRSVVTNYWGGTETAWPYTLTLTTNDFATANSGYDTCTAAETGLPITTFPVYLVGSNNAMANNYDPQASAGCANTYFKWFAPYTAGHPPISEIFTPPHANQLVDGDGVSASGRDSVFKVVVPAGKTLIVGMEGYNSTSAVDAAVYVLADTDTGATDAALGCPATPGATGSPQCLAANDTFGVAGANSGTDSLHWYNSSALPASVFVVIDTFGSGTQSPPGLGKWVVFMDAK